MSDTRQVTTLRNRRWFPAPLRRAIAARRRASGAGTLAIARLAAFTLALIVLTVGSVAIDWGSSDATYAENEVASETIKSPVTMTFQSDLQTAELRQEAFDDERNIVRTYDAQVRDGQNAGIAGLLDSVAQLRGERSRPESERITDLRALQSGLSDDDARRLLALPSASWERVTAESRRLVDDTLADPIEPEQVARVKEDLSRRVSALLTSDEQALAVALARPFIRSNVVIDDVATLENRQEAADEVQPVPVTVLAGQVVIRDGDIVSRYDIETLEKLGLLHSGIDAATRVGRGGLMALLSVALVAYLARFQRPIWDGRLLLLVSIVVLGPILMGWLILPHPEIQYMFPLAASAMLLAVLLGFEISIVVATFLSLFLGVVSGMSLELVVLYFISAAAGAFVISNADRTVTFLWAGLAVGATSLIVSLCFQAIESGLDSAVALELSVEALVMGALSASLTFLSFSLLGSIFGITTHLQLLELAHPNQPLLYRLAREAPGTYHHSIVVSNLAESGVEIVGGDPLFARVAVLYHDVGKIVRPTFFIENQANLENPHDLLDPRVSARVILDHVSDGVRLAKKARLPEQMVDIIQQHHGTSLIQYFYARSREAGEDVSEDEFRYPGPRPQTKEAGVIMLADSVEAAVRAAATGGRLVTARGQQHEAQESLEGIVQRIFQARLDDAQLDECDLTLREIDLIRRTFVQILEGIYHPRIDYPHVRTSVPAPTVAPTAAT